ncbi:TPA: SEC10/PgrA surface exclusion domain-containing protein [Streptococcus suis]|uniref:SEC10/PgrA surface exclusion domain-containing protein n=1 Tax=Streptococcus suis TaxID=1307 RepID=UPI00042A2CE4|nr:SEC10/PgrA surface exclusion domain-containing protein [Streptococcus suis]NQK01000.1 SEC10/PgrA surface exclusion domain-containing protein [Streptococcus suis]NQK05374.1 SEC10/PgrA surface exclusion domain-containing protein [Streptococcus suis]NQK14927.1 SEC10/PgrA surface exclusion domain-containing protein [Streptococcus suis]NQL34096.1 SEC10/PgrA surface exclusion domain-containing protein [Streptococcus suis]VTS97649.1 LPXTG cell wall surface protein [Streptococcus suis]
MNKKTLKTIATGAAITLATVGASTVSADTQYGIFLNRVTGEWQTVNHATGEIVKSEPNGTYSSYEEAQASLATSTVETPKTSADVQPALDAQQAVVDATAAEASQAQADADAANQTVTTAQAEVDTATQAVKDAEANAVNATPENIAANQADQAANLADQEANATETDQVNAEIVAQTQTVADAQTAVDTAQAEKDQADATVTAKEADVKAAQDAISGTGLAEAQANLDNASEAVTDAKANVDTATQAVEDAKKADADRDAKIKAAETEVAVKSDAVKTATDALANVDVVTVNVDSNFKSDLDNWKANPSEDNADFLKDSGFNSISASTLKVGTNDAKSAIDVNNLTKDNQLDMSFIYVDAVNQLRKQLGLQTVATVTDNAITIAQNRANQYKQRGTDPVTTGHIPGAIENLARLGSIDTLKTVEDIKNAAWQAFLATSFDDSKSNWNHLTPNMYANGGIGLSITNINGQYWLVAVLANDGTPITNPNDPATLQAALAKAQADQSAAQAASDTAQANLVKASSDYAKALELKTQAEKTLADATATPLQTQVAENNLRLAEIALQNAEARKADAQKAVDNFSASLAEKKAALDAAKTELAQAQATATAKAEALETAKVELAKQQGTLDSLNKDKDALLAEKDRLVEEAKALAEELQGYLKAPAILANAQATLTEKQADLTDAQAKAETAQNKLETVTAKLAEEKAKLAELQAEYNKLKDIEDKAKDNVIATLPDGTIVAVPKDAPTAVEKPAINIDAVKDAITKGQDVTVVDGKVVVTESQAGVTITQTATGEKVTYSRAERAKALPNTGEQTSLLALAGVAVLSSLGLTGARRKRRG